MLPSLVWPLLLRLLQKSAGLTPRAFLTGLRLGLARRKLLAGNDILSQIMAEDRLSIRKHFR
jgi:AraC-like DNA-binding protein